MSVCIGSCPVLSRLQTGVISLYLWSHTRTGQVSYLCLCLEVVSTLRVVLFNSVRRIEKVFVTRLVAYIITSVHGRGPRTMTLVGSCFWIHQQGEDP